ncbi:MAG: UvrD-helicase domain-containing protein [Candidatus Spechtbacterales bacterium]|nr:UvrD-helicase domain-containing protein [Candidatus Spechtbacterales bacterium]
MKIISSLNPEQKKAVKKIDGPLLVLAGPGSGKTKTLTHRIAYLIQRGISPQNILAVTFTNKAAQEMKDRVRELLKEEMDQGKLFLPWMGTFHSICVRILRENSSLLGYTSKFLIYDTQDQLSILKKVMKELEVDKKQIAPQKILSIISGAKDDLITPEEFYAEAQNNYEKQIAEVYRGYQKKLEENNGLDFDDLIMKTVLLFKNNESLLKKYQNRFKYIMVDEYQDTNTSQYTWLQLLAKKHGNICVVGDDAQAIYSWRNAKIENILNFERDWPKALVIKLEKNYRSTENIVKAASELIKNNSEGYEKDLWTENRGGEPITIKELGSEQEEAEFLFFEIQSLEEEGYGLDDFVILYRTNAQSRAIEEIFLRNGVPYKIVGGTKFYQRQEIKDAVAWIRLIQNPADTASQDRLQRLKLSLLRENLETNPTRKVQAIDKLLKIFRKKSSEPNIELATMLRYIIEKANYEKIYRDETQKGEEKWQNLQELLSVAQDYAALPLSDAMEQFLEDVALMQETDNIEQQSEVVHLMTLHMAKGLEFPVVFIAGCEEGLLPHSSSMMSKSELEEERRLAYVGLTRAKEKVYLLFARRRVLWGNIQANPPSSFLFEIPEEHVDFHPISNSEENEDSIEYLNDEDDVIEWW